MPDPTSFLQWLHQTYTGCWKGTVDITTVPAEDHAPKNSHWVCTIKACGAVVKKDNKSHSLQPLTFSGDARNKKAAEHAAAEKIYRHLVAEGWWNPEAPPKPKNAAGVSRAHRYITDSTRSNEHNPLAYLEVSIGGQPAGRITLELFRYKKGDGTDLHAPMAVDNFLAFCRGVEVGGKPLSYVGTPFTRVVKRFVVQAGDVVNKDGTGGAHIHSSFGEHFPDEGLDDKNYRHQFPFVLSAANLGLEDTNSSQFFITVAPCSSLDGHHTCFGKVLRGFSTVKEIEHVHMLYTKAGRCDRLPEDPPVPIIITAAGELQPGTVLDDITAPVLMGGGYPAWAEDQGPPPEGVREVAFRLDIAEKLKQWGNKAYKQGEYATALRRYRQAYHYLSWTTFKNRLQDGDCDVSYEEQDSIWQAEGVLLGNMVAAQIKLGQFAGAVQETCPDLIRKAPDNPKTYLRTAQARIGLGPGEYDNAVSLLNQALAKAKEQGTPTKDIVAELHRIRDLRKAHTSKLRAAFTSAFNARLLHHPSDDAPPAAAAAAAAAGSAVGRTWRGLPVAGGPVGPEHVIEDVGRPVVVEDAWGTHLLVADDGYDYDYDDHPAAAAAAAGGGEDGGVGTKFGVRQQQRLGQGRLTDLLLRQARLHNAAYGPRSHAASAAEAAAAAGQGAQGGSSTADGVIGQGEGWEEDGWGGGLDAGVDQEEEGGRAWWKEEGDSEEGDSDEYGQAQDSSQQPTATAAAAAAGDGAGGQQQRGISGSSRADRAGEDLAPLGEGGVGGGGAVSWQGVAHANGHSSHSEPAPPPAAAAAAAGDDSSPAVASDAPAAASGVQKCEGGGEKSEGGDDEVGVPEAVDASEQRVVVVSDSSSISKGGYGWKPEAMPRWSRIN